jgi:hypothetical protein
MTREVIEVNEGFSDRPEIGQVSWPEKEIAEVSLLMCAWEAAQLVTMASVQRVTVGQLLRGLIREFLAREAGVNRHQEPEALALDCGSTETAMDDTMKQVDDKTLAVEVVCT